MVKTDGQERPILQRNMIVGCVMVVTLAMALHTLSKPLLSSLLPSVSPIPANSVTDLSPIGSETKL